MSRTIASTTRVLVPAKARKSTSPMAIPNASLPTHDQIAQRAFEIYEQNGREPGHCQENWLQAERELLNQSMARHRENLPQETDLADDSLNDSEELGSSHLHLTLAGAGGGRGE